MNLSRSKQFKKDMRQYASKMSDKHFEMFINALSILVDKKSLPASFKDHQLSGKLSAYREFHIGGDLLVLYTIEDETIYLFRLGTHAEVLGL
jgi:mRNA interferase YafQ